MLELPTGTVTFLFTDIEGSTRRWEQYPQAMPAALARHDAVLRQAIAANAGVIFQTAGDSFAAAFTTAPAALSAALTAQRHLQTVPWEAPVGVLRVRMALHTGSATLRADGWHAEYPLNHLARLLVTGHGGQTLLSAATQELVRDQLPPNVELHDMGTHRLKDLTRPEHIFQVVASDLPMDFPALKTLDRRPHNLPVQPTALIGREKEIATVCSLLRRADVRLVTSTFNRGAAARRSATTGAAAATCSKLSSSSRSCFARR